MPGTDRQRVGIDATPLAGGHAIRGIGRYLDGVLRALGSVEPDWARDRVGLLEVAGQAVPIETLVWRTRRSPIRPQDVDVLVAPVADRWAIRRSRPRGWQHTDPSLPWSPLGIDRTVVTVYDLIPLAEPAVLARIRPHRRVAYQRYVELARRARGVIAISETTAAEVVARLGIPRSRIRVVPPWVEPPAHAPVATFDPAAPLRLLFVGVPDPHKRPQLAIDTLAELGRRAIAAELDFVGVHPPRDRQALIERIAAGGLTGRVHFHDRVDDSDLARRYASGILLATSSVEGFGLPPVEAVLAGGRVVATSAAAYRETLEGTVPFARDDTAGALADAVVEAAAAAPTAAARADLRRRFSPGATADALIAAQQYFFAT